MKPHRGGSAGDGLGQRSMESEFELKIDRALKKASIPGTILIVIVFILLSSFSPAVADFFRLL